MPDTIQGIIAARLVAAADTVVLAYYTNDDGDNASRWVFADGFLWQDPALFLGHAAFAVELVRSQWAQSSSRRSIRDGGHQLSLELIETLRRECERHDRRLVVIQLTPRESTRFRAGHEHDAPYRTLESAPDMLVECATRSSRSVIAHTCSSTTSRHEDTRSPPTSSRASS